MSRLGLDYGTTNTVVVCSDRGRYPVVPHMAETAVGPVAQETFPSLAVRDLETGTFLYGLEAERALFRPGASERYEVIRSLKRLIKNYAEGVRLGQPMVSGGVDCEEVLTGYARAVRESVLRSGVFSADEPLEAVLTWPAKANGAQRYLTRRCFREAGFDIIGTLSEPAAAAIEFADRMAHGNCSQARQLNLSVGVFDLGGGTFDVSLVKVNGSDFTVLEALGIEELGGDDFDQLLATLFLEAAGIEAGGLRPFQDFMLLRNARLQKESISSGTARLLTFSPEEIGLKGPVCTVPVEAYFERLTDLIQPAVDKLMEVVSGPKAAATGIGPDSLGAIYLVGGSSRLPLVPMLIARRFPNIRLVLSDKPFTATAMGAAIRSTETIRLHDILARTFGVVRLADYGTRECFSPIFPAGTRLPARGEPPLEYRVEYSPCHNIGHLRYLECGALDSTGWPSEGIRIWSDVLFPYDTSLPVGARLTSDQIVPRPDLYDQSVCEIYSCDADGVITARITRLRDGQAVTYEIFRAGD